MFPLSGEQFWKIPLPLTAARFPKIRSVWKQRVRHSVGRWWGCVWPWRHGCWQHRPLFGGLGVDLRFRLGFRGLSCWQHSLRAMRSASSYPWMRA